MHEIGTPQRFFLVDAFHTVSLGVGKNFASSAFSLLQELCEGSSVDQRFKGLSAEYLEYCKDVGVVSVVHLLYVDFISGDHSR